MVGAPPLEPPPPPPPCPAAKGTFQSQLAELAATYDCLETQNRELRRALAAANCRLQPNEAEQRRVELKDKGPQLKPLAALEELDIVTDMSLIPVLHQDGAHKTAPPRLLSESEGNTTHLENAPSDGTPGNLTPGGNHHSSKSGDAKRSTRRLRTSLLSIGGGERNSNSRRNSWLDRPPIFIDADEMKERVRQQIASKQQSPTEQYKTSGWSQAVAKSGWFETLTLGVIAINALWIWIDTDYNEEDVLIQADAIFQIAENIFCTYFSFEIVVRFLAFSSKRNCLNDTWFIFDLILVIMMILETWVVSVVAVVLSNRNRASSPVGGVGPLGMVRMMRLFRMARMVRLLRAIPEFMILMKAIGAALRSVFFCLALLCIFLYSFGIALTQILNGSKIGSQKFDSVPASMQTLFLNATLLDSIEKLMKQVRLESWISTAIIYLFILVGGITIMNMLIGVLCEVVTCVAATEREVITVGKVQSTLQRIMTMGIDEDGDGKISKSEFASMLTDRESVLALQEIGVDAVGLVDLADTIFGNGAEDDTYEKKLSFGEFMGVILEMRGSNKATVKDIVNLRKFVVQALQKSELRTERLCRKLMFGHGPFEPQGFVTLCSSDDMMRPMARGRRSSDVLSDPVVSEAQTSALNSLQSQGHGQADRREETLMLNGMPEVNGTEDAGPPQLGNFIRSMSEVAEAIDWFLEVDAGDDNRKQRL